MKRQLLAILLIVSPGLTLAAGAGVALDHANIDRTNLESMQRGAKTFVNYCLGCHSARFQRYNRLARDLEISEEAVIDNLMFTGEQIGAHMDTALTKADGKRFFGAAPPDLTLVARVRGADWLYTYMRTFYLDPTRPFGVNNRVFPNVGMPHVLWELQGWQAPVYHTEADVKGKDHQILTDLELVTQGSQTPAEYDRTVRDLVNFLSYMGEPVKLERQRLGIKVLLYLLVFFILAYLLKKEYWKDVH